MRHKGTLHATVTHRDGTRAEQHIPYTYSTLAGRRRAIKAAERRTMRANPTWQRIDWVIDDPYHRYCRGG